jgi:hypothetical protein
VSVICALAKTFGEPSFKLTHYFSFFFCGPATFKRLFTFLFH